MSCLEDRITVMKWVLYGDEEDKKDVDIEKVNNPVIKYHLQVTAEAVRLRSALHVDEDVAIEAATSMVERMMPSLSSLNTILKYH